eukprot:1159897-Pelagomonas_calceolata.AAC.7
MRRLRSRTKGPVALTCARLHMCAPAYVCVYICVAFGRSKHALQPASLPELDGMPAFLIVTFGRSKHAFQPANQGSLLKCMRPSFLAGVACTFDCNFWEEQAYPSGCCYARAWWHARIFDSNFWEEQARLPGYCYARACWRSLSKHAFQAAAMPELAGMPVSFIATFGRSQLAFQAAALP